MLFWLSSILCQFGTLLAANNYMTIMIAAVGYSLIYLLFGGGLGGAVLIFIVAKMLGK